MKKGTEPAYPLVYDGDKAESFCHDGMSIRLKIASEKMDAIMSSSNYHGNYQLASEHALEATDFLIKLEEETRNE